MPNRSILPLTFLATSFALIAFAANSVLCRLALGAGNIDPASFTIIRLTSGALTLFVLLMPGRERSHLKLRELFKYNRSSNWLAPLMLFGYAMCFSFAYVQLNTASGALILFASVQLFMIGSQWFKGNRLSPIEWLGAAISLIGFVFLMLPGATRPSNNGFVLMTLAGIAWGIYTLEGKNSKQPIINTAENFIRCFPLIILLLVATFNRAHVNWYGVFLAIASGSVASGLGYAVWYRALASLSVTQAAVSQLSVPLIAALGGVLFVGEQVSFNLIISGLLILSGIALVSLRKPTHQFNK